MSSISRKLSRVGSSAARAVRTATNPLSIVENKLIETVAPGYSNLENQALNPFSNLNKNIAWTVVNPQNALNPVQTALTPVNVISQITTEATTKKAEPTVKPNYESYSSSASKAAHNAGLARAKAEREKATQESIANAQKANAKAYQAQKAAEQKAVKEAEAKAATSTPATASSEASAIASTMTPAEQIALINAVLSAREAAAMNQAQELPEVEVKSDFGKYLLIGGGLLLAFYLLKNKK